MSRETVFARIGRDVVPIGLPVGSLCDDIRRKREIIAVEGIIAEHLAAEARQRGIGIGRITKRGVSVIA